MARSSRRRWLRWGALALGVCVLLLNAIAFMQARSMTHYVASGARTDKPENLSVFEKGWILLTGVTVPRPQNTGTPTDLSLTYETHRISVHGDDHLEAWHVPSERAKWLVLMFPGYAESKSSLLPAASALHGLGWDSLLVDFRGAGGSSGSETTLGFREAEDVAHALRYSRQTWSARKVVLYGVSMGSAAVLRAVSREGAEADGLILESPFDNMLNTVRNRFGAMGFPAWPGAELVVFWGGVQIGGDGFAHNPSGYARSVSAPTLLMHGEHDPRVTPEQARSVYSSLAGPKWIALFPGAGHEALVVQNRVQWQEKVEAFLDGVAK
jgi:uncharacterized protein